VRLAVVVPTLGRPALAARVLTEVAAQARDDDEVLAVDQSDAPDHAALREAVPARVRILRREVRGLPGARNAGIAATTAPIVLFLDDDVRLHPGCLDAHRAAYVDPTVGGAVGRIHEHRLRPNARRTTNRISAGGRIVTRLDGDEPVDVETLKGANMSLRRAALDEVGGFDEGYVGTALLEDADLSTRVAARGWRLRYLPDAAVDHLHAEVGGVRVGDALRWRFRNTAYFVRTHRGWPGLVPVALTFATVAAWKDPRGAARLGRAFVEGWAAAGRR
jgi:GT2 family glycosyltransferase